MRHTLGWINISLYSQRQLWIFHPRRRWKKRKRAKMEIQTWRERLKWKSNRNDRERARKETEGEKQEELWFWGWSNCLCGRLKSAWSYRQALAPVLLILNSLMRRAWFSQQGCPAQRHTEGRTGPLSPLPPVHSSLPVINDAALSLMELSLRVQRSQAMSTGVFLNNHWFSGLLVSSIC